VGRLITLQAPNGRYHHASMAKVCHSCGKRPAFGNSRSHSMVATRRRFNPNLQKVRIQEPGGGTARVYVCARCMKSNKVTKAA
jgi:large subunit ribosomal protein L28